MMKRILAALSAVALIIVAVLIAYNWKSPPERAVCTMLDAMQNGKITKAEKYIYGGSLSVNLKNSRTKKFYKAMFSTIQYIVTSVSRDGDSAKITVSITMADMDALINGASVDLLSRTLDGDWNPEKVFYSQITSDMINGEYDTVTVNATVHLVRTRKGWKVNISEGGLPTAITGGISSLIGY